MVMVGGGGRKVFKFVFKKNDFTCKSIDEVKTLGKINVFMLMTASIDDTFSVENFLLFITLTRLLTPLPSLPPSLPADG